MPPDPIETPTSGACFSAPLPSPIEFSSRRPCLSETKGKECCTWASRGRQQLYDCGGGNCFFVHELVEEITNLLFTPVRADSSKADLHGAIFAYNHHIQLLLVELLAGDEKIVCDLPH